MCTCGHNCWACVPKTTIIWGTVPEIWSDSKIFVILDTFLPFQHPLPSNNPKKKFFEKLNKASGQIWNGTDNFFVIWGHFLLFYPTIDPKNCKNHLEVLSFYTCLPLWCMVPEIESAKDAVFFVNLDLFCFLTLLTTQKIKILKN